MIKQVSQGEQQIRQVFQLTQPFSRHSFCANAAGLPDILFQASQMSSKAQMNDQGGAVMRWRLPLVVQVTSSQ